MKLETVETNVQRSGDFEERTFAIKANAKAFDILSSKIYSDIVRAIIRELSTNAWDAHIDAQNTDTPFKVHIPNDMKPFFQIRDFGTSMTHDQVMHLYTTYFESNKTHSNDFTGCLGIGSKSPFAYTDSFSVTAFLDGESRVYSMFKGEEGFPKVALLAKKETDEPNGLEISLPVDRSDFYEFKTKAQEALQFFPKTPEVTGATLNLEVKPVIERDNWRLTNRYSNSYIIMGCVGYPVNSYETNFSIGSFSIEIDTPIGAVDISANREALQYTEKTNDYLKVTERKILKELQEELNSMLEDSKSLWEASVNFQKLASDKSSPFHLQNAGSLGLIATWNDKPIEKAVTATKDCEVYKLKWKNTWKSGNKIYRENDSNRIPVTENLKIIIDDLTPAATSLRVRGLMRQVDEKFTAYVFTGNQTAACNWLMEVGLWSKVIKSSKIPKVKRTRSSNGSRTYSKAQTLKLDGRTHSQATEYWEDTVIDPTSGGLYLRTVRGNILDEEGISTSHISDTKRIATLLKNLGLLDQDVVGIRKAHVEKIITKGSWVPFKEWAQKKVKQEIKKKKIEKRIAEYNAARQTHIPYQLGKFANRYPELKISKILAKIKKKEEQVTDEDKNLVHIARALDLDLKGDELDYNSEIKDSLSKYPLLDMWLRLRNFGYGDEEQLMLLYLKEYIDLIDKRDKV